jgi:hypothetical protein
MVELMGETTKEVMALTYPRSEPLPDTGTE